MGKKHKYDIKNGRIEQSGLTYHLHKGNLQCYAFLRSILTSSCSSPLLEENTVGVRIHFSTE